MSPEFQWRLTIRSSTPEIGTGVYVYQNVESDVLAHAGKPLDIVGVIDDHRQAADLFTELTQPPHRRLRHHGRSYQDVLDALGGERLRFADLGAADTHRTRQNLPACDLSAFVRLCMRAKLDTAPGCPFSHPADVAVERLDVDDQGRCRQIVAAHGGHRLRLRRAF